MPYQISYEWAQKQGWDIYFFGTEYARTHWIAGRSGRVEPLEAKIGGHTILAAATPPRPRPVVRLVSAGQ